MTSIGYARAGLMGESIEQQLEKLKTCDKVFREKKNAAGDSRPQLEACLKNVGQGDTLVVTSLDRLARSTSHLYSIVEELEAKGANLRILDLNVDFKTKKSRSFFDLLEIVKEFERAVRAEHQLAGLKRARQRGARIGVPRKLSAEQATEVRKRRKSGESLKTLMEEYRVSRSSLYRYLTDTKKRTSAAK